MRISPFRNMKTVCHVLPHQLISTGSHDRDITRAKMAQQCCSIHGVCLLASSYYTYCLWECQSAESNFYASRISQYEAGDADEIVVSKVVP